MAQPSYWRWERGEGQPGDHHLAAIADYIGVTTEDVWLMLYAEPRPTSLEDVRLDVTAHQRDIEDLRAECRELRAIVEELRRPKAKTARTRTPARTVTPARTATRRGRTGQRVK